MKGLPTSLHNRKLQAERAAYGDNTIGQRDGLTTAERHALGLGFHQLAQRHGVVRRKKA